MNHKITQIFVPSSVSTSLTTDALGKQVLGIYNPTTFSNIGGTTADADFLVAIGSAAVGSKYGSFKTSAIKVSNIISAVKTVADTSIKQQITYIGFDEVNDSKSPSFSCDEEYVVTLKIDEYWSKGVFQPMIQESVSIKTACCADCAGGCDSLGCSTYMSDLAGKINASPLLSKYVTASYVYKGTLPTYKYTLTLPDPGTNVGGVSTFTSSGASTTNGTYTAVAHTGGTGTGATFTVVIAGGVVTSITNVAAGTGYTIGDTLTIASASVGSGGAITLVLTATTGAEGTLLNALKAYYPAGTYGAITFTADTDGDPDADSLNNSMFEIATPLISDITLMPLYNNIAWEKVLVTAAAVTACGIKIIGNAMDEFGNACVPDAVPYVFNLVRFKVNIHEGPYNTQDFDIENFCAAIPVTTTQDIKYPLGEGKAMAEMERHYFGNNLPATSDARRYWNPIYNEDSNAFLYVNSATTYDMYEITYLDASPVGFEKKSENTHSVIILAASGVTAAVATALNNVLPTSLHV
jgi:hypothetical protein